MDPMNELISASENNCTILKITEELIRLLYFSLNLLHPIIDFTNTFIF